MGKKKAKKVSGAVRTAQKTQKNAEKKAKKNLRKTGEKDIDELIAEFKDHDKTQFMKLEIKESKCAPPTPRSNMSLTTHPEREELIMFGGECDTGKKSFVYNDLYYYNLKNGDWSLVSSPDPPPPRCAHQAVSVKQRGGQLWIFGGEFVSPTQSQFHHWKDLWVLHLKDKRWEKVRATGGPSSRSGHRMVALKKQLIVFGGFHDNVRNFKYFNDVYSFNLETNKWTKLEPTGHGPSPRSGCQMLVNGDQTGVLIYGGYTKERVKKDVDVGHTHSDMFMLLMDTKTSTEKEIFWKWQPMKQTGTRPSPRCGMSPVNMHANMAFFFGGVFDQLEDEEDVSGIFYNEMYTLEMDKGKWHTVRLRGTKDEGEERKRRRKKDEDGGRHKILKGEDSLDTHNTADNGLDGESEMECEQTETGKSERLDHVDSTQEMVVSEPTDAQGSGDTEVEAIDDGIFKVTIGGPSSSGDGDGITQTLDDVEGHAANAVVPSPRMSSLMTVKHSLVYLYGGIYEEGDKQITHDDLHVLDLHKMDTWKVLETGNASSQKWEESDDSLEDDEEDDEEESEPEGAVGGNV